MVVRKQITNPPDVDQSLRGLSRDRGISQSALIVEAIRALPDPSDQLQRVLAFAGMITEAPSRLSEEVDETLYG